MFLSLNTKLIFLIENSEVLKRKLSSSQHNIFLEKALSLPQKEQDLLIKNLEREQSELVKIKKNQIKKVEKYEKNINEQVQNIKKNEQKKFETLEKKQAESLLQTI